MTGISEPTTYFSLDPGTVITFPKGPVKNDKSWGANVNPETPRVYYLGRSRKSGYYFGRPLDDSTSFWFRLFGPDSVKPGEQLIIKWRHGVCACAERVSSPGTEEPITVANDVAVAHV